MVCIPAATFPSASTTTTAELCWGAALVGAAIELRLGAALTTPRARASMREDISAGRPRRSERSSQAICPERVRIDAELLPGPLR